MNKVRSSCVAASVALAVSGGADAYTSGNSPFCLVDNYGNAQCFYYSLDACRQAASYNHQMCAVNVQPQQQVQIQPATPPQPPPSYNGYQQGYNNTLAGAQYVQQQIDAGRQHQEEREQQQREAALYAQQMELLRLQQEQARANLRAATASNQPAANAPPVSQSTELPDTSVPGGKPRPTVGDFMAGGQRFLTARNYLVNLDFWTMALIIAPGGQQVICLPNSPPLDGEAYAAIFERQLASISDAAREAAKDRPVTDVLAQGLRLAYPCNRVHRLPKS